MSTVGCDMGYQSLTTQINAESSRQITLLGLRLYPKMSQADAEPRCRLPGNLDQLSPGGFGFGTGCRQAGHRRQLHDRCPIHAARAIRGCCQRPDQPCDGTVLRSTSGLLQADGAGCRIRCRVRNAIELVQYAVFPVFLLFVVLSGHQAGTIIKSYAASLFWIQLWAPLYAVMNFIITMYSKKPIHEWKRWKWLVH